MFSVLFYSHPDKQGRQYSEYERLYKSYHQLYHTDKDDERHCYPGYKHRLEDEDQGDQAQDQDVTCGDVRKKSDHQSNWLGE